MQADTFQSPLVGGDQFNFVEVDAKILPLDTATDHPVATVRITVPEPSTEEGENIARKPVDVCCVIDVSRSMEAHATYEVDGEVRTDGLTLLDLAAHGVKVVLASLKPADRFALVSFNDHAKVEFPLSPVTDDARERGSAACSRLKPFAGTNIWDGLRTAMDALREGMDADDPANRNRNRFVLFLSDGRTGFSLRDGHTKAFRDYCATHSPFQCQVSTFGLGYRVDSGLMFELAACGTGTFAFIPTAPVLGTVFDNAIAGVLSTHAANARVVLRSPSSSTSSFGIDPNYEILGGVGLTKKKRRRNAGEAEGEGEGEEEEEVVEINLGPLLFGQTRDVLVPMVRVDDGDGDDSDDENMTPFLTGHLEFGDEVIQLAGGTVREYDPDSEIARVRAAVVDQTQRALQFASQGGAGKMAMAHSVIAELLQLIDESPECGDERVVTLRRDVAGRITKALDGEERFKRWGQHFLRAICRAHAVQQCTNNLDPGVQCYGGLLFRILRTRCERLFLTIPPPVPSRVPQVDGGRNRRNRGGRNRNRNRNRRNRRSGGSSSAASSARAPVARAPVAAAPVDMERYTYGGGGCFGASSSVMVVVLGPNPNSSSSMVRTLVSEVKSGDYVLTSSSASSRIICVVEMKRMTSLVAITPSGPFLTPKHPIKISGKWERPKDVIANSDNFLCLKEGGEVVYNFVLDDPSKSLLVDGFECVTLGHGLREEGAMHGFYGSGAVVEELRGMRGWKEGGRVRVGAVVRNREGHAVGLVEEEEEEEARMMDGGGGGGRVASVVVCSE